MNGLAAAMAGVGGGVAAWAWLRTVAPRRAAGYPVRTNVAGADVPVVLGEALLAGGGAALCGVAAAVAVYGGSLLPVAATIAVLSLLGAAGRWDDRRGDERPRGYSGHLGAARAGRLTGGIVKLAAGTIAGLAAAALTADGWRAGIEVALLVPLTANLVNLFDRAPGRAGKVALVAAVPLLLLGDPAWRPAGAGVAGALVACMPRDLAARGMLGDEGANAVGGVLGLGLALSLGEPWRLVALAVVAALNAASERWSFARAIERVPALRALDRLGRE
ncbi:MAG: hypothetical protein ABR575_08815 [Actinomycetota bacterium]